VFCLRSVGRLGGVCVHCVVCFGSSCLWGVA